MSFHQSLSVQAKKYQSCESRKGKLSRGKSVESKNYREEKSSKVLKEKCVDNKKCRKGSSFIKRTEAVPKID